MKTTTLQPAESPLRETHQPHWWIFSPRARPVRFIVSGLAAATVQITVLSVLVAVHIAPELANIIAVVGGTQANFVFSSLLTWHDMPTSGAWALTRRWLRFVIAQAGTALLNEGVFLIVYRWLPVIVASLLASSLIALLNYTLGKRFIFSH